MFNDNLEALRLAQNPVYHSRSKHIDMRHHFIRDSLNKRLLRVAHVFTNDMPADMLTKGLPRLPSTWNARKFPDFSTIPQNIIVDRVEVLAWIANNTINKQTFYKSTALQSSARAYAPRTLSHFRLSRGSRFFSTRTFLYRVSIIKVSFILLVRVGLLIHPPRYLYYNSNKFYRNVIQSSKYKTPCRP